jgi:hypothetical protein
MDDWNDNMTSAPRDEPVLICLTNCQIIVGIQKLYDKAWLWVHAYYYLSSQSIPTFKPKAWTRLPLPPKYLYERKLTADVLAK